MKPVRKAVPMRVRRVVCERQGWRCKCGCGQVVGTAHGMGYHFDHEPALELREIAEDGSDWIPPQHSTDHLDAYAHISHAKRKTSGSGATTAGTDIGRIKKQRKRREAILIEQGAMRPRPRRKIQSRGFRR